MRKWSTPAALCQDAMHDVRLRRYIWRGNGGAEKKLRAVQRFDFVTREDYDMFIYNLIEKKKSIHIQKQLYYLLFILPYSYAVIGGTASRTSKDMIFPSIY